LPEFEVTFLPDNIKIKTADKITLLKAAQKAMVTIQSECGGKGICGKCKVKVLDKNFPVSASDRNFFNTDEIEKGWRLACKSLVKRNLKVEIPSYGSLKDMRILLRGKRKKLELLPGIKKLYLKLTPPSLQTPDSFSSTVKKNFNVNKIDLNTLQKIPEILIDSNFEITGIIRNDELITIERGDTQSHNYGIAFDIGTTTIVGFLVNLNSGEVSEISSRVNSQISFGADVITRINHAITDKKNLQLLHKEVIKTINSIINELVTKSKIEKQYIYELTIAGNTVMSHLLLNISPESLSHSPFNPVFSESIQVKAKELLININPNAHIYIFPNIGGFIGGDIVSGMLIHDIEKDDKTKIAVDIGTNGETVMGNKHRIVACSNAMGPAFEGAHITCGIPAVTGAINKIDFTENDIDFTVIGNLKPKGICGSALIDLVAGLLDSGIINQRGRFENPEKLHGKISDALLSRIHTHKNQLAFTIYKENKIILTQSDIREIQLAKAAIHSAIKILLKLLKITEDDISEIYIAGAFGNYIRPENALRIGLIPDFPIKKIQPVGNAAGEGAIRALLSLKERKRADIITNKVEHVELSVQPNFQDIFTESLFFP